MAKNNIFETFKKYRFEIRHVTVLFFVLIIFQIILSYIQKNSLQDFLTQTQTWYQEDSAERLANLTSTSLELIIENVSVRDELSPEEVTRTVESLNIILSQQLLQQNVKEICLVFEKEDRVFTIDDGESLFNFLRHNENVSSDTPHKAAVELYNGHSKTLKSSEEIYSEKTANDEFQILVPFVPHGEYLGALYMKNNPDFSFITYEIISSFDEAAIIFSSLIILGLLAMYYISSYTVKERDEAQKLLFHEHEENIKEQIRHEKESLFTKRIYHTHHKAEKVMGFIKEDLRTLNDANIEEVRNRVKKYSNFVSRVIYDMKWYDPPISAIRSQLFNTDINHVIKFLVDNLFLRIAASTDRFAFNLDLDENLPSVRINEFIIWEVLEPIIQNSIDHSGDEKIKIFIKTKYDAIINQSFVELSDDGPGIQPELLKEDEKGVQKIFIENVSTKELSNRSSGYGCYIAYHLAVQRCGWEMNVRNLEAKGCKFTITIKHG
ncbi:MAG: ATP-binding protein [Melioribacteraceae bacterium]|nr:ATP-binding protein [Melioribacteraceae bacterium]MCF8356935.1 ATP-binding protein [Melioribacteraceae bacterium]MCF8396358.1 ATP-binding protein [Melioribacteraceae bacterium]MCF8421198.1 ATP-binding protein [Melioribacteraceae bacterium]